MHVGDTRYKGTFHFGQTFRKLSGREDQTTQRRRKGDTNGGIFTAKVRSWEGKEQPLGVRK
jgi:hypothetical protein